MNKFLKKLGRIIFTIFESFFAFIDKIIIMPISRLVYNISKSTSDSKISLNKLLNRPHFLIVLSLIFAVICFLLIDNKVISLIDTEAEIIKNVPVKVIYNEEAFVVENVPETVDITIAGKKSDIYLAKQLGEFEVELNLSKYTEAGSYKVYFTYSKSINSVEYKLDPSYLNIEINDRVSDVKSVDYELINSDKLNKMLSVSDVTLDGNNEVVVKGSQEAIDKISSIKALISLTYTEDEIKEHKEYKNEEKYTKEGTYTLTNIPLVAYGANGEIIKNVDIVPKTLNGTLVLNSYKNTVPITVLTTGKLVSGKAIASILINNKVDNTIDIYGEEEDIKNINSVVATINVDGYGAESVKNYTVVLVRPTGVRYMSARNVTITATFGDEEQKTVEVSSIDSRNLAEGYSAVIASSQKTQVQVKGVRSNIDNIEASSIRPYVDLANLGEGTHEVEVKIDNNNPLVNYVVSSTITVKITKN